MSDSWQFFLLMIIACLIIEGFFSMLEMAVVSFNRVRLYYYTSKKSVRAKWLARLLSHPAQLFGTTLIGVNGALQFGSEAARRFYLSLDINPDWAPVSQLILVVIFAELAPLFAARRYAEHVSMLGIPIIYFFSVILRPIIWIFEVLCFLVNKMIGSPVDANLSLSREELQRALEEKEEQLSRRHEVSDITARIFALKGKKVKDLLLPMSTYKMAPLNAKVEGVRTLLARKYAPFVPIFASNPKEIVALLTTRDLMRAKKEEPIKSYVKSPWFISEESFLLEILSQFRRNNKGVAVVLNQQGEVVGYLTLDAIIDDIFGYKDRWEPFESNILITPHIDLEVDAAIAPVDFNKKYKQHLPTDQESFADLIEEKLGHVPATGESLRLDRYEITVVDASLTAARRVRVRSM